MQMIRKLPAAALIVAVTTSPFGGATSAKFVQCSGGACLGSAQFDVISGSIKPDTIVAGAGNDAITEPLATGDNDRIFGGPGDDFINVREGLLAGGADFVDCGPGTDAVVNC